MKPVPALEHVVDRLGDGGMSATGGRARSRSQASSSATSGALCSWRTRRRSSALRPLMPRSMSNSASMRLTASSAIGEIAGGVLAAPGVGGDVGQLEELPPGVRPAQRRRDRPCGARRIVERVVAAIGVGLQDAGEACEMRARDARCRRSREA